MTLNINDPSVAMLAAQDCAIQVWQTDPSNVQVIRFFGPITGIEYTNPSAALGAVKISASSPGFRLAYRYSGKSITGTAYTTADRAAIANQEIINANTENETGIQTGTVSCGSTVASFTAGPYKLISDVIKELASSIDGFDWYLTPISGVANKMVRFDAAAVIGATRANAIFEYGTGRNNIIGFKIQHDWTTLANRAFHLPEDLAATGATVVSATDSASVTARRLYETAVETSGITDTTLRQNLVNEHVRVRKAPRVVMELTLAGPDTKNPTRVPTFGTDYDVGDFITVHITYNNVKQFTGAARVYGVTVNIDINGRESVVPTLVDEDGQ